MSSLPYEIVDVFTDRPFTGNPLAVVFEGEALDTAQMQALAREFNLSETVFVLPPETAGATYRVRIFTPRRELPFAGHPSVGTAVTLFRRGVCGPGEVVQECGAGLLALQVSADGQAVLTGGAPTIGPTLDPAGLASAVGLTVEDVSGTPQVAGSGLDFAFLPVWPGAVVKATPGGTAVRSTAYEMVMVFAWDASAHTAHARVFALDAGVAEDPATGSAALGLGVYLVANGLVPASGISGYTVFQGSEIHRPSTLDCTVTAVDGAAISATTAGHVVSVATGQIAVPPFIG